MKIRAVICDIYATLLELGPPPKNPDALWGGLFAQTLGCPPRLTLDEFSAATVRLIERLHADARARGILWPEVQWPAVVVEVIPDLARLSAPAFEDFLVCQMRLNRTLKLAVGAAECLRWLQTRHCQLGVASNSQAYTLREVETGLSEAGLALSLFDHSLCFWSFEHGFSKPDPHVFRILTARLEARGIAPGQILMVGDRLDNDLEPARAQGWQTWHLTANPVAEAGGNWYALRAWLERSG